MMKWISDWWWTWNCKHDHQVVYQDNCISVEQCTKCNHGIRYGG